MTFSKQFKVSAFPSFEKELTKILSTYPGFRRDLDAFIDLLKSNPEQGKHLGSGVYKARLEITGKPAGKSYGARVIHAIFSVSDEVLLVKIYDKSVTKDLTPAEENKIRNMVGEIRKEKKKQQVRTTSSKKSSGRKSK